MIDIKLHGFARPFAGALAAAALGLAAAPSHAQQFTMKFATLTLNDVQHENLKLYKEELEKVTGGQDQGRGLSGRPARRRAATDRGVAARHHRSGNGTAGAVLRR